MTAITIGLICWAAIICAEILKRRTAGKKKEIEDSIEFTPETK